MVEKDLQDLYVIDAIQKDKSASGTPLQYYYYPDQKEQMTPTYRFSREMFDFFEKDIGYMGLYSDAQLRSSVEELFGYDKFVKGMKEFLPTGNSMVTHW